MQSISENEKVTIEDLHDMLVKKTKKTQRCWGKGIKKKCEERQMIVDFAKRVEVAILNTYFIENEKHSLSFESGKRNYVLSRRKHLKDYGL